MALNTFPCNPYPISTEELNKGNNDELNTRVTALEEQKANQNTIALSFNPETEYEVGDLVYYNGLTYRCTNAHTGEWDADDFAGTTIANELSTLKSGLTNLITTGTFNANLTVGDNILRDNTGSATEKVTSGTVPTSNNILCILINVGASNECYASFHLDGSGTFKLLHCNTDKAQSVIVKWYAFNI